MAEPSEFSPVPLPGRHAKNAEHGDQRRGHEFPGRGGVVKASVP